MKILHSVFTKGWGGLEKYPLTLVDEFKIRAHEIIIVKNRKPLLDKFK